MATDHTFLNRDGDLQTKVLSPIRAIREKCLNCCNWSSAEVERCEAQDCPLYPFRLGADPGRRKKKVSETQRQAAAERLRNAREAKQRKAALS